MDPVFACLAQAADELPEYREAAIQAAFSIAVQVTRPNRSLPSSVLINGFSGAPERLAGLCASLLKSHAGYSVLEVNCAQIRDRFEVGMIDGFQRSWTGARPGLVTSALYENPRTVVIFHDIDRCMPCVTEALRRPLRTGLMTDNYGVAETVDGDRVMEVNCRDALFIFTTSQGCAWYSDPDMSAVLAAQTGAARSTIRQSLQDATIEYRGIDTRVFDPVMLDEVTRHMVLLPPPTWQGLVRLTECALTQALQDMSAQFRLPGIRVSRGDATRLSQMHLLSCGSHAGLQSATGEALEQGILGQLQFALLKESHPETRISLRVERRTAQELEGVLKSLGPDPLRTLARKAEALEVKACWHAATRTLRVRSVSLHAAQREMDYRGSIRLTARVPDVKLAQVAGLAEVKEFFSESVALMRDPAALQRLGIDLPKGALLWGPPGTGKTLLAQAFAGEAGLPFIAVSGSDLLQLSAVRRL